MKNNVFKLALTLCFLFLIIILQNKSTAQCFNGTLANTYSSGHPANGNCQTYGPTTTCGAFSILVGGAAQFNGLSTGSTYTVATNFVGCAGCPGSDYITVTYTTQFSGNVIAHGYSPLTVPNLPTANVRINISTSPSDCRTSVSCASGCSGNGRRRTITLGRNITSSCLCATISCESAGPQSVVPNVCINTPIPSITHSTTGATGIGSPSGLPAGVTAAWSANTITISGTPTQSGTFNYSIPLTGSCGGQTATGTITVNAIPVIISQPQNAALCYQINLSDNVTITSSISGGTVQWQYNNGGTWVNVVNGTPTGISYSNETTPNLTITGDGTHNTGIFEYRMIVTNGGNPACTVTSNTIQVTKISGFRIAPLGPQCSGATLNFEVFPSGGTSYSWEVTPNPGMSATPLTGNNNNFSTTLVNPTAASTVFPISAEVEFNGETCMFMFNPTILPIPEEPTITVNPPNCSSAGSASISNFDIGQIYTFNPNGPTVDGSGNIISLNPGTDYTVTASIGACNSIPSNSFTVGAQLPTPAVPSISTVAATCSAEGTATVTNYDGALTYTFTPSGPTVGAGGVISNATAGTSYTLTAGNGSCTSAESSAFTRQEQLPQPTEPSATNCWDDYQFNATSCSWVNNGTEPTEPSAINCWDDYQFNATSCSWVNNGTEPTEPSATNCWDDYQFNATSCSWVNNGTQPTEPSATNCWDDYQFNATSCSWVNNGTQPTEPSATNCWDDYQFNTTSCSWVNNGTEPTEPSATNCWDDYQFNATSCSWVNNGTQPTEPSATNCWDDYQFNTTSCSWVNNGTQPTAPSNLACYQTATFNSSICNWEITGDATNALSEVFVTPAYSEIIQGQSVQLTAETTLANATVTFVWTPATGLSCANCPNPIASPSVTTTYTVFVVDEIGCEAEAEAIVIISEDCPELFFPTIFSPNGDGNNDSFCIYGGCIASIEQIIFNRWGEEVFITNDPMDCWDGKHHGEELNSGVFVHKTTITFANGETKVFSGSITLVK